MDLYHTPQRKHIFNENFPKKIIYFVFYNQSEGTLFYRKFLFSRVVPVKSYNFDCKL